MYNQHTRRMAPIRHRSLVKRRELRLLLKTKTMHTHKKGKPKKRGEKMSGKTDTHESKGKDSST